MPNLLLTFDYELFLGRDSGTVEDCLIRPTSKILKILEANKLRGAIFFIDTIYLVKLKGYAKKFLKVKNDFDSIANQIKQMVSLGQYVFPHIHPHWEDAIYLEDENKWDLSNSSKYRFNSITDDLKNVIFDQSIDILKEIIHTEYPNYKLDAYRAGGYSIQPFSDFKTLFIKHGIKYEFSVLKNFYEQGRTQARNFDFRDITHLNYYKFSNDIREVDYTGSFIEFTISSFGLSKLQELMHRISLKISDSILKRKYFGNGIGAEFSEVVKTGSNFQMASFEYFTFIKGWEMWKKFEREGYLQTITHPKMMSEIDLKALDSFIRKAKRVYENLNFDFKEIEADKPNILICSHILPPQPGIGGRRWTKFAKYLTQYNYNVKLLTSEKATFAKGVSPWTNDVKGMTIQVLKRKYSVFLEKSPTSLFEKLAYRIWLYYYLLKHKGSIYDKAINWENQFKKRMDELLIKENIYCSIATGAPFSLMYYNSKLKESYPKLKVMNDFRDPWTWGEIYGFENLDMKRMEFEESREKFVIENSDYVTSCGEVIHEVLLKKYSNQSHKIKFISHAFDTSEVNMITKKELTSNRVKIIFGGTLYENLSKNLRDTLDFFAKNKDIVEVDFYVSINPYDSIFNEFKSENIRVFSQIGSVDFISKTSDYDFYLSFTNERIKDIISTKYYELIACKLPFLYIGPKGALANLIEKYKLGHVFMDIENELNSLQIILKSNNSEWGFDSFPIEEYSFESITKKLEVLINEPIVLN